ncbi:peptide-methionine (S)-S-oxide reductase MsrA [Streptomyces acidiscabies]|uniref:Peptide methionine sulfoxide reductase MsrA n=1 Tax=Streptomyces acidiscabies TaxID=42234 RepID=A0A0L0K2F1_9ACTN|nr:peptide-methionine (S)-S-oxide reductase MsrA [Streptomyces acidiscabies]KND31986.1 peptide methionine sulfoxide reductase [Streptomyces acidiscabies]
MVFGRRRELRMPTREEAPVGRGELAYAVPELHAVLGTALQGPYPEGCRVAEFALGCFWGGERRYWQLPAGVWTTAVGFQGGFTPFPVDDEVRTGLTGHAETVRVVYEPEVVSYDALLRVFWEGHDPTQGFRQGNDVGTHVRSLIFTRTSAEAEAAESSRDAYQKCLAEAGYGEITTEILAAAEYPFYPASSLHQQYLAHNPGGYCGLGGTGVTYRT